MAIGYIRRSKAAGDKVISLEVQRAAVEGGVSLYLSASTASRSAASREPLAALEKICLIPCDEYEDAPSFSSLARDSPAFSETA